MKLSLLSMLVLLYIFGAAAASRRRSSILHRPSLFQVRKAKMVQNTDKHEASPPSTTGSPCLSTIGFAFLTTNTILSSYRARDEPWTVAFVLFAYLDLLALFACLQAFEKQRAEHGAVEMKPGLKVAIWVLANALNVAFAYRVAQMMPLALYAVAWGMSGFTVLVTFYGLFVCGEAEDVKNNDAKEVFFTEISVEEKV